MTRMPPVTVIVPTREEAVDIEGCLAAIAGQDYPVNRIEVLVVDGCSTDGTEGIARRSLGKWGFGSTAVVANEGATASSNLNVGLARAAGDIVCRVDARTRIEPHYVRTCVDVLRSRPEVAVVGGAQVAIARDPTARAIGIARALNNRWSMGGSPYRRAVDSGVSDTVYLGAFRRADLVEAEGWDERLVANQDFDLNRRMAQRGLVWFDASLRSGYLPRASLGDLWRQYRRFGRAKVHYWRSTRQRPEPRQWLLLAGPPAAATAVIGVAVAASPSLVWLAGAAGVGVGGFAALEVKGADEPLGGLGAHLYGVVATAVVGVGWWTGVVAGLWAVREPRVAPAAPGSDEPATEAPHCA